MITKFVEFRFHSKLRKISNEYRVNFKIDSLFLIVIELVDI